MTISGFVAYIKQAWKNKPDTSTPLSADRLTHIENGIKGNSDAIQKIAAAVVSQIVNDPNKIASMAALYSVNQSVNQLNTDFDGLNNSAVTARQRSDRTANEMVGSNNRVEFYIIDGTWGTTANKFPLNSAGVLQVMNLYGSHAIQVFYPLSNSKIYKRENNGLTSWTAWTEK